VGRGHDSRRPINRAAEEVIISTLHNAHMHPGTNREHDPTSRSRISDRELQLKRRLNRIERVLECGVYAVAHHFHDGAVVQFHGGLRQLVMPRQCEPHPLRFALPQTGTAFNVSEEKGERARVAVRVHNVLSLLDPLLSSRMIYKSNPVWSKNSNGLKRQEFQSDIPERTWLLWVRQ
jgi:hypothetical protein